MLRTSLIHAVWLTLCLSAPARAQEVAETERVSLNSSRHLRLGKNISRVSVGSSEIADVAAFPPDQILITGKRIGRTTVTVWSGGDVQVVPIEVTYPTAEMNAALRASLPDAKDVAVQTAGASLVITGQVTDPADVERAEEIIKGFATATAGPSGQAPRVINSLTVPGDHQVQLEVSFAEVSRTGLREIGLNFWYKDKQDRWVGGMVAPTSSLQGLAPQLSDDPALGSQLQLPAGLPVVGTPLGSTFGLIFSGAAGGKTPLAAALSVLAQNGYSRTLSEPTLVAMSGEEATFLAGGEFPIPIPQTLGQISVEYKKFGIQLKFTPTVVGDTIQLKLAATVSDVDFSLGLRLANVTVPGLTERYSSTTVRLRDGQSFAIAGLLSDRVRSSVDKIPGLGDLPVLGALFRSTSYRREETELLVVVTAHIVRPQDERPRLPGEDTRTDPSDLELFLFGSYESKEGGDVPRKARKAPAGPVGFRR